MNPHRASQAIERFSRLRIRWLENIRKYLLVPEGVPGVQPDAGFPASHACLLMQFQRLQNQRWLLQVFHHFVWSSGDTQVLIYVIYFRKSTQLILPMRVRLRHP
jgi:hypothetical protein